MASSRPEIRITKSTSQDYVSRAAHTTSTAFSTDPVFHYFLNNAPSKTAENAVRQKLFNIIFHSASISQATFWESSTVNLLEGEDRKEGEPGFQCAAAIMPPGKEVDSPGFRGWIKLARLGLFPLIWAAGLERFKRVLLEYPSTPEAAKKATFAKGEEYYYVLMIATDERFRGKGLCPALIKEVQKLAQEEGKPIWLESTTEGSRRVYQRCGFLDVKTDQTDRDGALLLGKGKCDGNGDEKKGGEGVKIYPMVWWPVGYVRKLKVEGKGMESA